jgi:hypothetical protein
MENIIEEIHALIADCNIRAAQYLERQAAYRARIDEEAAEHNLGLPPTWGADGRPHAPCDNYLWGDDKRIYMGGQYLPLPDEDGEYSQSVQSPGIYYVNLPTAWVQQLTDALDDGVVSLKSGKTWEYKGVEYCRCELLSTSVSLSKGMVELIDKHVEKLKAKPYDDEPGAPVVEGRIVVSGVVLTVKMQEGYYGWEQKMLVRDDRGFKVWGTVPSCIEPERGSRVEFTATVNKSDKDETFGLYKRPSKAKII